MNEGSRLVAGEATLTEVLTVAHGQEEMIEVIVRQNARLVYRIAYAVLRSHHDAEDATQETFVRVLRYGKKLAGVDDPKTWLARIAWRVAIDRRKHQTRRREVPLDDRENPVEEAVSSETPADETLRRNEVSTALESLIAALPKKLREPLVLSTLEEMSPREIAVTLGISEAAVRSRVFRARQILRGKLMGLTAQSKSNGR
jgi:RNA polymerase sigma-70 factor (ECF subfamily)